MLAALKVLQEKDEAMKPVKVRLGEKYSFHVRASAPPTMSSLTIDDLTNAYVAGFDRAKSLCVDFCERYIDKKRDMTEDEEVEWLKKFTGKVNPSHHMNQIGEQV